MSSRTKSLRAILIGCGALLLTAASAQAACHVTANGTDDEKATAQRLARFSQSGTVSGAYTNGTCTITKVVHGGGQPCPGTNHTNHATVTVAGIDGAYHVFTIVADGGWCTTH